MYSSLLSVVIKVLTKTNSREENIYFTYMFQLQFITEENSSRTWSRELKQRPWRNIICGLLFMAHLVCFLILPRTSTQGCYYSQWPEPSYINFSSRKHSLLTHTHPQNLPTYNLMEAFFTIEVCRQQ